MPSGYLLPDDSLTLFPAVDVRGGQAVRLVQGESGSETNYGNPLAAALDWQAQGAQWIHLVDLDAAFGTGNNTELITEVIAALDLAVEVSGGIRDDASLQRAVGSGAQRINLGTAALENPEWTAKVLAEYGDLIAIGLDVRGTTLATRGWTQPAGELYQAIERLNKAGCKRYVVTDVTKDGTLRGPNLQLLTDVAAHTDAAVIASGGIATLDDLRELRELVPFGVEGAIIGKALYAGAFTLPEALQVASGVGG